ncbi:MAG: TrkH family potassium uptake protein [Myxococcales bacterium]
MRIALVFGVVGQLLRIFSAAFVPPILLALVDWDLASVIHFAFAMGFAYVLGTLLSQPGREPELHRGEALSVVALSWLGFAVIGAIPYVFAGVGPIDALFEAMSGLTTTGATIFTDFARYGRALFLWRAMTQWFGGLGVIALFVVVLPRLGIAGRQLFFAEASGAPSEALSPQVRNSASRLWILYSIMTALLTALLVAAGMTPYEGILHALTTVSAGGFSPNGASIAGYDNAAVEWILTLFMLLAGASYTLQYRVFTGRWMGFFQDGEFKFYFGAMFAAALLTAVILTGGVPGMLELRLAAFQAASLMSSTGYASIDYNEWPDSARAVMVTVMMIGGCAGSAAGGPKAVRFLLVLKRVRREITRVLHPRAVLPVRYGEQVVPEEIMRAVFTLVVLFLTGHFIFGVLLVLLGADLVTGFSAALACLGNVGPGFGPAGPMGNFAGFPDLSKLILTFAMWIGRLEIVTVLALFHPDLWREARLTG